MLATIHDGWYQAELIQIDYFLYKTFLTYTVAKAPTKMIAGVIVRVQVHSFLDVFLSDKG